MNGLRNIGYLCLMFQMLGLGEKAGSGFGKILRAWKEQQWLYPLVSEKLALKMTSVFTRHLPPHKRKTSSPSSHHHPAQTATDDREFWKRCVLLDSVSAIAFPDISS